MQINQLLATSPLAFINKLRNRRTLMRAAENTGWLLVNHGLRVVGSLVIGIWVARYLGPEQYGLFNYAIAYVGLFATVVPLGLNQINMRDLAVAPEERNKIIGSSMAMQAVTALLAIGASLTIAFWSQQNDPVTRQLILIVSLTTLLQPFNTITYWWRSQHRSVKIVMANGASLTFMVLVRTLLLLNEASVQAFAMVVVAEQAVYTGSLIFLYQRERESLFRLRWNRERARTSFREGIPFLLSALATSAFVKGNQIMVKLLAGATANGYFAAATRISSLWVLVPNAIVSSAMPLIAKAKQADQAGYERQTVMLIRICTGLGIGIAALITLLAPWFIPLLYGPQYVSAAQILVIQVWYAVPQSVNLGTTPWIVNEGLARVTFQKTLVQAALVLGLNFWLIPRYAGVGAALSILIAALFTSVVWDFTDPRLRELRQLELRAWIPWLFSPASLDQKAKVD